MGNWQLVEIIISMYGGGQRSPVCVYSQQSEGSVVVWGCFHQRGRRSCQTLKKHHNTKVYIYIHI